MGIHTKGGQCEDKRRTFCELEDGHPQAKEEGADPPLVSLRRHQAGDPRFAPSSLQNGGATHFCCLSHTVRGTFSEQA